MDNLAYNLQSTVLVANELKLNGKKNLDQILKYALMYNYLEKNKFIESDSKFLLLFIGGREADYCLEDEIEKEIEYCKKKGRYDLITDEILVRARSLCLKSITWMEMIDFNKKYISTLNENNQVEIKLLSGFNLSLQQKSFMNS